MANNSGDTDPALPLVRTKLHLPRLRLGLVERHRLRQHIDTGHSPRLTLLCAPPGFGKSTLAAQLASSAETSSGNAWISLSSSENDSALFWAYVIEALKRVDTSIGATSAHMFRSQTSSDPQPALTALVNEITASQNDIRLVLDDYHVIEQKAVHDGIDFLLEHAPSNFHLIITSRIEPPLRLGRLRAQGELAEIRESDLRFTQSETASFINETMGLQLSESDLALLGNRTEGWVAGLQLAALSLRGRDDASGFIKSFSGVDQFILDYLVEEVLQRQEDEVRQFLLDTSILTGLTGPLCDAVTGRNDGDLMLRRLSGANLFVLPLDNVQQWYRYHHLFADVLNVISRSREHNDPSVRHRRAAEWYSANSMWDEAVSHAIASTDDELLARTLELAWPATETARRNQAWLDWIQRLPEEMIRERPALSTATASAHISIGEIEAGERYLDHAERWLDSDPDSDDELLRTISVRIANSRSYLAQTRGDMPATARYAERALSLIPEDDAFARARPSAILSLAQWANGDLAEADATMSQAMTDAERNDNAQFVVTGAYVWSRIRVARGQLDAARVSCQRAIELNETSKEAVLRGVADSYLGLAEIDLLQADLDSAAARLETGDSLADTGASPFWNFRRSLLESKLLEAHGDLDGAIRLLEDAEQAYVRGPVPEVQPTHAMKARLWIKQGRLDLAREWWDEQTLTVNDALSYSREYAYLTLVRILIVIHEQEHSPRAASDALSLLHRLEKEAADRQSVTSQVEIGVLASVANAVTGDRNTAVIALSNAASLAEPQRIASPFIFGGAVVKSLLRHAVAEGQSGAFTRTLLSAFNDDSNGDYAGQTSSGAQLETNLTERELEVLRLISVGMRNQEIADQLFISVATVKRHISNAYNKLGVTHRTEAIARAGDLALL